MKTIVTITAIFAVGFWLLQTPNSTPELTALLFADVEETHPYERGVAYMVAHGYMRGYEDGSFRPEQHINRAEFAKVVVDTAYPENSGDICIAELRKSLLGGAPLFPDVPPNSWFEKYVCVALVYDLLAGYSDQTFRPATTINAAEASKVLALAFNLQIDTQEAEIWYMPYTEALVRNGAFPVSIRSPEAKLTRAELAEMLYRLKEDVRDAPALLSVDAFHGAAFEPGEDVQGMYRLINTVRETSGVSVLHYNSHLEKAALHLAQDLDTTGISSHISSDGLSLEQRVLKTRYLAGKPFYNLSENVGTTNGSKQLVFDLWLSSPEHNMNMFSPLYADIGIAHVGNFWVAVFGSTF
jgi:hypothetical protein